MSIPVFPTPPAPPQRGVDDENTFRVKADVWTNYQGFQYPTDLTTFGAALIAEATSFFTASSTTLRTLGTGAKALTIEAGKAFKPLQYIQALSASDPTKYLFGTVTSYNATTGALVINVTAFSGSGDVADWSVSISGPQGVGGFSVLSGAIAPVAGLGRDGDFYYNTATYGFYGPKAGGAWPAAVILKGNTVLNGTGAPGGGLGNDGDYYINNTGKVLYGPKTAGAWGSPTQLVGPPGGITETVFNITDAAAFEVDPANGGMQFVTLGANRTPKATNFADGQYMTLEIDDGATRTVNWTDATWGGSGVLWKTDGGTAPQLASTDTTVVVLWKRAGQVRGARVGNNS